MHVNISRSKLLINAARRKDRSGKDSKRQIRCNHCGGAMRNNGEMVACLMCARDITHICSTCTHVRAGEVPEKSKKSA